MLSGRKCLLDTLMRLAEDYRKELVMILAGYEQEMGRFS
jgi:hypothetical protein